MPDAIGNKTAHDYHLDVPAPEQGFFAKGLGHGDWGAKNRLSHLFNPKSGNTVMLAFDHGYIMGATAGLERMDVTIAGTRTCSWPPGGPSAPASPPRSTMPSASGPPMTPVCSSTT